MHPSTSELHTRTQLNGFGHQFITKYVYLRGLCLGNERIAPLDDDDDDDETPVRRRIKNAHETLIFHGGENSAFDVERIGVRRQFGNRGFSIVNAAVIIIRKLGSIIALMLKLCLFICEVRMEFRV